MSQQRLRVYADTSVFGGTFDEEFAESSRTFFEQVRQGRFSLTTSGLVQAELLAAPRQVAALFDELLPFATIIEPSADALALRQAYLSAGIVAPKFANDALHVALATVAACTAIVSWNFKHIVHFRKVPLYNAVSVAHGYPGLVIVSPREVIEYEDEGV